MRGGFPEGLSYRQLHLIEMMANMYVCVFMCIDTLIRCVYRFIYSASLLFMKEMLSIQKEGFCFTVVEFQMLFHISFGCANDQKGKGARSCCLPFQPVPVCLGPVSRAPILLEVFAAWQCSLGAIMTPFVPVSDFVGMQGFCFTFCGAPAYYLMLYLQFYSWRI